MSVVYVSSSGGSDRNSGASTGAAVKTIAKAKSLMDDGDQMLLKSGDAWSEAFGQWDWSNSTIGAYGSGAKPKVSTSADGIWINEGGQANVTLRGISLNGLNKTTKVGVCVVGRVSGITLDNVEVKGFRNNVNLIGSAGSVKNVTIKNSKVSYSNGNGKSSGLFADGTANLTIDNSVFDHNGGTSGSMYNHGAYITALCTNVVVRNSTFSNSSSHGLQARAGGTITGNKFVNNSVGLSVGIVNGAGTHTSGGVTCVVSNNTFSGKGLVRNRGIGVELGNIKSGRVTNNTFVNGSTGGWQAAIYLGQGTAGGNKVGIVNLVISGNTVDSWGTFLIKTSNAGIKNLVVSGNDV